MTKHSRARGRLWVVLPTVAALWLALAAISRPDPALRRGPGWGSVHLQWRPWSAWKFGVRQVAYCSVQAPTFLEWQVDLGPVALRHLRLNPAMRRPAPEAAPAVATTFPGPVTDSPALEVDSTADLPSPLVPPPAAVRTDR